MIRSDFAGAIALFERAATADPNYAPPIIGLSAAYFWLMGNEQRCLELAQKAVEPAPESADAYVALARVHNMRCTTQGRLWKRPGKRQRWARITPRRKRPLWPRGRVRSRGIACLTQT